MKPTKIPFMKHRKIALVVSALLLSASIGSLLLQGLTLGLDFTGGTQIEMVWEEPVETAWARTELIRGGFDNFSVTHFGQQNELLIRLSSDEQNVTERVLQALNSDATNPGKILLNEYVGPQVGDELFNQGGLGMLLALGVVMLYIAIRFQLKFAVGAVAALMHDVLVVLGIFSIMRWDFDLSVLAAVLAVIGYSLNDTIVVSDRIRENFLFRRNTSPVALMDISLNQTLGRTLITSFTTLLVLVSLLLLGGELIANFARAMTIGVLVGTYSSIYVAATTMLGLKLTSVDLIVDTTEEHAP